MTALFPNCAFLSETSRMLGLARGLRERGEEVALGSQGGPYEGLLDESGLPWTRLAPGMGREEALDFVRRVVALGYGADPLHSRAFLHEAVRSEAELLRDLRVEMVVVGLGRSLDAGSLSEGAAFPHLVWGLNRIGPGEIGCMHSPR